MIEHSPFFKSMKGNKLSLSRGEMVADINDPKNVGIYLQTQDGKPGDIDVLVYFLRPQIDGHHVVEVSPLDLVEIARQATAQEKTIALKAYKAWQQAIKAREAKFKRGGKA